MPTDDPLATYSPADLAAMWDITERTVQSWVASRRIAHIRFGPKTIRFSRAQIEAFVAENTVPVQPALAAVPDIRARRAA